MHTYLLPTLVLASVGLGILVVAVVRAARPGPRSGVTASHRARDDDEVETPSGSAAR